MHHVNKKVTYGVAKMYTVLIHRSITNWKPRNKYTTDLDLSRSCQKNAICYISCARKINVSVTKQGTKLAQSESLILTPFYPPEVSITFPPASLMMTAAAAMSQQ